jgi:hypothetical protein
LLADKIGLDLLGFCQFAITLVENLLKNGDFSGLLLKVGSGEKPRLFDFFNGNSVSLNRKFGRDLLFDGSLFLEEFFLLLTDCRFTLCNFSVLRLGSNSDVVAFA